MRQNIRYVIPEGEIMGFRCPICRKDFQRDEKEFKKHCEKSHMGAAKVFVDAVISIAENMEIKDEDKNK
jgi:hypothetical protein